MRRRLRLSRGGRRGGLGVRRRLVDIERFGLLRCVRYRELWRRDGGWIYLGESVGCFARHCSRFKTW